jgi:hypothetical protein
MQARKLYLDTQSRTFVASPDSTLAATGAMFFDEDIESVELYFLEPTDQPDRPYSFLDYSSNTVKFAVGTTTPAALQTTWAAISSSVTATITNLVTGGSGTNEQQRITLSPKPVSGGFALQLPSRTISVSSVAANVFTAADHGLFSGQSVSLTSFSFTSSAVANGSSYFVIRNSKDTFSLASTANSTTALTASVTSGGGTVTLPSATTGQLAYNAEPSAVQAAFVAAGLAINNTPQILVTGTAGQEYILTYANGSANRDYANVSVVGSTLLGAYGLSANVSFSTNEVASLVSAGTATAKLEIEVSGGGRRQTYQQAVTLAADIISSSSPTPVPGGGGGGAISSFILVAPNSDQWSVSIDNSGVLTATKQ